MSVAHLNDLLLLFRENSVGYRFLVVLGERFDCWVATTEIAERIWLDGGPLNLSDSLKVYAYNMRRRLAPYGYTITGKNYAYNGAYRLTTTPAMQATAQQELPFDAAPPA